MEQGQGKGLGSVILEIIRDSKSNICELKFTDINGILSFKKSRIKLSVDPCNQEIEYCRIKSILAEAGVLHMKNTILIFKNCKGYKVPIALTARGIGKWVLLKLEKEEMFSCWYKAPEKTMSWKELGLDFSEIAVF